MACHHGIDNPIRHLCHLRNQNRRAEYRQLFPLMQGARNQTLVVIR
jgi:hypothetical protein